MKKNGKNQFKISGVAALIAMVVVTTIAGFSPFVQGEIELVDEVGGTGPVGWAVGWDENDSGVILHTADGGLSWEVQGDMSLWTGWQAWDISAVDDQTAWAALGKEPSPGLILHTTSGGQTWKIQDLPAGVNEQIKGIKGLSRQEAWAVGLWGTVLHTTDGGATWTVIPHDNITIKQVNRIDALGNDIWIADCGGTGENAEVGKMVHSADCGSTWRAEEFHGVKGTNGPMTASIVNSQTAWSSVNAQGDLYRTTKGGSTWIKVVDGKLPPNDIDDLCAIDANRVWGVQNNGSIFRADLTDDQISHLFNPTDGAYNYEGVTCLDEDSVWVVGFKNMGADPTLPRGVILHTTDGGANWANQPIPVDDVELWKVSFVGALR